MKAFGKKRRPGFGKRLVILLDSGAMRIGLVSLGRRTPQVKQRIVVELPVGAVEDGAVRDVRGVSEILRSALRENKLTGIHRVVFCLCSTQVLCETAQVPDVELKWLGKMIQTNRDIYFPVDTENHEITYIPLEKGVDEDGKPCRSVKIWAAPRELLRGYYQVANDCGLYVSAIDYCGESFLRAARPGESAREEEGEAASGEESGPEKQDMADPGTDLVVLVERDFLLMTFFRGTEAVTQRYLQRGGLSSSELGEARLEQEMYLTGEGASGGRFRTTILDAFSSDREYISELCGFLDANVNTEKSDRESAWLLCDGAAAAWLDFGNIELNNFGRFSFLSQIWQYALFGIGAAVLLVSILLYVLPAIFKKSEIEELKTSLSAKEQQLVEVGGYADRYQSYLAEYQNYLSDWRTILGYHEAIRDEKGKVTGKTYVPGVLQTYNDNVNLIFSELEAAMPKNTSVVGMRIENGAVALEVAGDTKQDMSDLLLSLRYNLKYSSLYGDFIPNLTQGEGIPVSDDSVSTALTAILNPAEEAPEEGGTGDLNEDDKLVLKELLDNMSEAQLRTFYTMLLMGRNWDYTEEDYRNILDVVWDMDYDAVDVLAKATDWLEDCGYTLDELQELLNAESEEDQLQVQRQAVLDTFTNPFAMFIFVRELKSGVTSNESEKFLAAVVVAGLLTGDGDTGPLLQQIINNGMSMDGLSVEDLEMLREKIPGILSQSDESVKNTVDFIKTSERLKKYYAYHLASAMGLLESGGDAPVPVITPEPTPEPTPEATPEATPEPTPEPTPVPTPGAQQGSGGKQNPVVEQAPDKQPASGGGQTPEAQQAPSAEPTPVPETQDSRYYTTVILVYNEAMRDSEPGREGLDPDAYVPMLEVGE